MRDTSRLTRSCDFQAVYRNGRAVYNKCVVLRVLKRGEGGSGRVGFVVKKKIGSAVARNRVKRLLKEGYRAIEGKITTPHDIVFVAKKSLRGKSHSEVASALGEVLKKAGLLEDK